MSPCRFMEEDTKAWSVEVTCLRSQCVNSSFKAGTHVLSPGLSCVPDSTTTKEDVARGPVVGPTQVQATRATHSITEHKSHI